MTLRQRMEENFSMLLKCIDPSNELLAELRSVVFVRERLPLIDRHVIINSKTYALLTTLMETPDELQEAVMNGFVAALRASGQDHVANVFRRESEKFPMSEDHYKLLSMKKDSISKFLDPRDALMDILLRDDVFSETNRVVVLSKTTVEQMARQTVDVLLRRPDCDFGKFINAVNEAGQSHVSYIIVGVGKLPMSHEHRGILRRKMKDLCKYIDTDNGLLESLFSDEVLSNSDTDRVRSNMGYYTMARELVNIMMRKPDDAFDALIDALNETGQSHVSFILTGQGDNRPLDEQFRKKLTENRRRLVESIDSKYTLLITQLIATGVFSEYDKERVTSRERCTNNDRAEVILDLMARKSQTSFDKFIVALKETDQEHVAVEVVGVEVFATIVARIRSGADVTDGDILQYIRDVLENNRPEVTRLLEVLHNNEISVRDVHAGSVIVTFGCLTEASLNFLKFLHSSRELDKLLTEAFCAPHRNRDVLSLCARIPSSEYRRCEKTFSELKLMTSEHHEMLESSAEWLVDNMTVTDDLLEKLSLCERRRQAIERAGTREEQVETLIDVVSRRPDSAFEQFLNALQVTNQRRVAEFVRKTVTPPSRSRDILPSPQKMLKLVRGVLSSRENTMQTQLPDPKRKPASVFYTETQRYPGDIMLYEELNTYAEPKASDSDDPYMDYVSDSDDPYMDYVSPCVPSARTSRNPDSLIGVKYYMNLRNSGYDYLDLESESTLARDSGRGIRGLERASSATEGVYMMVELPVASSADTSQRYNDPLNSSSAQTPEVQDDAQAEESRGAAELVMYFESLSLDRSKKGKP